MNEKTGEIREFNTRKDAEAAGFTRPVKRLPDPKCKKKHCYGTGNIGRDPETGLYVPCDCVL